MATRVRRMAAFVIAYWMVGPALARDAAESGSGLGLGWLGLLRRPGPDGGDEPPAG